MFIKHSSSSAAGHRAGWWACVLWSLLTRLRAWRWCSIGRLWRHHRLTIIERLCSWLCSGWGCCLHDLGWIDHKGCTVSSWTRSLTNHLLKQKIRHNNIYFNHLKKKNIQHNYTPILQMLSESFGRAIYVLTESGKKEINFIFPCVCTLIDAQSSICCENKKVRTRRTLCSY